MAAIAGPTQEGSGQLTKVASSLPIFIDCTQREIEQEVGNANDGRISSSEKTE